MVAPVAESQSRRESEGGDKSADEYATAALRTMVANHFSLGQFELGRACLRQLEARQPGAGLEMLALLCEEGPPRGWAPSPTVPSSAHLRWMCLAEFSAISETSLPRGAAVGIELRLLLELVGRPSVSEAALIPPDIDGGLEARLSCPPLSPLATEVSGSGDGVAGGVEDEAGELRELLWHFWAPLCGDGQAGLSNRLAARVQRLAAVEGRGGGWEEEVVAEKRGAEERQLRRDLALLEDCSSLVRAFAAQQPGLVAALVSATSELLAGVAEPRAADAQRHAALVAALDGAHVRILRRWLAMRDDVGLEAADELHRRACFRLAALTGASAFRQPELTSVFRKLLQGQPRQARLRALQATLAIGSAEMTALMEGCVREEEARRGIDVPTAFAACLPHWEEGGREAVGDGIAPIPPPLLEFAMARGIHVFEAALTSSLRFVSEGKIDTAKRLLNCVPPLKPLLLAMSWDAPTAPPWDAAPPGVALAARRALVGALWSGETSDSGGAGGCCVSAMCRQIAYKLEVARAVEEQVKAEGASESTEADAEEASVEPIHAASSAVQLLSEQSALSVLALFLPTASLGTLLAFVEKQPADSATAASQRRHDLRLLRTCLAISAMVRLASLMALSEPQEGGSGEGWEDVQQLEGCVLAELSELRSHLGFIADGWSSGYFARCWLSSVLRAVLLVDARTTAALSAEQLSPSRDESPPPSSTEQRERVERSGGLAAHVIQELLHDMRAPPPSTSGSDSAKIFPPDDARRLAHEAASVHVAEAEKFIAEAAWRLALLRRMSPPSSANSDSPKAEAGARWRWPDALAVLQASPLTLLYMCKQRNAYELGREAVAHFNLPESEFSALKLAEWMDTTATTAILDTMVSGLRRAEAEGDDAATFDFGALRVRLPRTQQAMLCVDVAVAVANNPSVSERLLQQAREVLADSNGNEVSDSGATPHIRSAMLATLAGAQALAQSSSRRRALCAEVAGVDEWRAGGGEATDPEQGAVSPGGSLGAGPWGKRMRALRLLAEAQAGIRYGRHQFLSGLLHNLAHALADDAGTSSPIRLLEDCGFSGGIGAADKEAASVRAREWVGVEVLQRASTMPVNYLAAMISYLAQIGDELSSLNDDGAPTETHNYFALIRESPRVLLPRLVIQDGCAEVALRIAALMGTDVLHEILRACLVPVYPPNTRLPPSPRREASDSGSGRQPPSPSPSSTPPPTLQPPPTASSLDLSSCPPRDSATPRLGAFDLSIAVLRPLAVQSTIRAALASVFWLLQNPGRLAGEEGKPGEGADIAAFALEISEPHRPLRRWIVHRLEETDKREVGTAEAVGPSHAPDDASPSLPSGEAVATGVEHVDEGDYFIGLPPECHDLMESGQYAEALAAIDGSSVFGPPPDALLEDIVLGLLFGARLPSMRPSPAPGLHGGSFTTSRGDVSRTDATLSWQCVMRMADKGRAAGLIWRFMLHWELQEALDAALLCAAGLRRQGNPAGPAKTAKMEALARQLQLYLQILATDVGAEFAAWQQLHASFQDKRGQVIRRLVASGAPQLAVDVVAHVSAGDPLTPAVAHQAHAALVTAMLGRTVTGRSGSGPMAALRHLAALPPDDMFATVQVVLRARVPLAQAKLLLQFVTQPDRMAGFSSETRLGVERVGRGAAALSVLEGEVAWRNWAKQLHHLLPHPELLLEALVMSQQVNAAKAVLQAIPEMHDDDVVAHYAEQAVAISVPDLAAEQATSSSAAATSAPRRGAMATKGPLSRSARNVPTLSSPRAGEAGERRYSVNVLSGTREYDNQLRAEHTFRAAPCPALFASLVDLASTPVAAAEMCTTIAGRILTNLLSEASPAPNAAEWCAALIAGKLRAVTVGLQAADVVAKVLATAEAQLTDSAAKRGGDDSPTALLPSRPDDVATAGLRRRVEELRRQVELLQTLLGHGAGCVLEELQSRDEGARSEGLLERLVAAERYGLAVFVAKKLRFHVPLYWEKWGFALMQVGEYREAETKFDNALRQLLGRSDDAARGGDRSLADNGGDGRHAALAEARDLALRVAAEVEHGAPADIGAVRAHVQAMRNSAMADDDRPMDGSSFLTILKLPTQAPPLTSSASPHHDPLAIAARLLGQHAPDHLLPFLFRHDQLPAACAHVAALPPYSEGARATSAEAADHSQLHQLCQLSVEYVKVDEMVATLSRAREPGRAALGGAETWMAANHHPHHLYRCQLALGHHLQAGMTACVLFGMAPTLDKGLQHLDSATGHFKDALGSHGRAGDRPTRAARRRTAGDETTASGSPPPGSVPTEAAASRSDVARQLVLTGLQIDVVNAFKEQELQAQVGSFWTGEPVGESVRTPREISLFVVPGERVVRPDGQVLDEEAAADVRREVVAEALLEMDFSLASRLMHDLRLPSERVYSKVANRLAREYQHDWLRKLLANLRATIDGRAESEVVMAAIAGYASVGCAREGERLVRQLPSVSAKVAGLLRLGLLNRAYQMARSERGNRAAMAAVLEEAKVQNDLSMVATAAAALGTRQ